MDIHDTGTGADGVESYRAIHIPDSGVGGDSPQPVNAVHISEPMVSAGVPVTVQNANVTSVSTAYPPGRRVAVSGGRTWAAYMRRVTVSGSLRYQIYVAYSDDGETWTEERITTAAVNYYYPVIGVDGSGVVHLVYSSGNDGILYQQRTSTWGSVETVAAEDDPYPSTNYALVVSSDGTVHVAWSGYTYDPSWREIYGVYYRRRTTTWEDVEPIAGGLHVNDGKYDTVDIAVSGETVMVVAEQEEYVTWPWERITVWTRNGTWSAGAQIDADADNWNPALVADDEFHLVYYRDEWPDAWWRYRTHDGTWGTPIDLSPPVSIYNNTAVLGLYNHTPYLIWTGRDSTGDPVSLYCSAYDGEWTTTSLTSESSLYYPSTAEGRVLWTQHSTLYSVQFGDPTFVFPGTSETGTGTDGVSVTAYLEESDALSDTGTGRDSVRIRRGDWAEVRQHPHTAKLYLAVKKPRIVWTGVVAANRGANTAGDLETDLTINISSGGNVTGFNVTNFMPDLTVWVGSTAGGRNHGSCRARRFEGSNLVVSADMNCVWKAGDHVSITDLHELWPRYHVVEEGEGGVTVYKDHDLDDSHRAEYPVPILGPPACQFLVDGEAEVRFYGQASYLVQPNSDEHYWTQAENGITGYSWWFEGGTPSTSTEPNPTVTWDTPGQYVVSLEVTGENGRKDKGFRNVFIFDDEHPPVTEFSLERMTASLDNHGWEAQLKVWGDGYDATLVPADAQAVLFSEEWFDGAPKSAHFGNPALHGRENIKMVGWLVDSGRKYSSGKVRDASLTMRGLQDYLRGKTNFPVYFTMVEDEAPAWSRPGDLTVRKVWYHLVKWHWTILTFTDFFIPDDHNNHLPGQSFPEGSLASHLDSFTRDTQCKWVVDKGGALHIFSWGNWLPVSGDGAGWRTRLYSDITLGDEDYESVDPQPRIRDQVARVMVEGVMATPGWYATSTDMAPGDVRNQGGATITLSNQVLGTGGFPGSQGHELAMMVYAEESRRIERAHFTLCGNYTFFDVAPYVNYFKVTTQPGIRDWNWVEKPFWVTGMDVELTDGVLKTSITAFPETRPDPNLQTYGQFDEIDVDLSRPADTASYAFSSLMKDIDRPQERVIPALMGDGGRLLEGDEPGTVYVRAHNDAKQVVKAQNRMVHPMMGRPIYLRVEVDSRTGKPSFEVTSPRQASTPSALSEETMGHTQHFAVFCAAEVEATAGYAAPSFVARRYRYMVKSLSATVQTPPSEDPVVILVLRNGQAFGTLSIAAGALDSGEVEIEQELLPDDRLDVQIESAGIGASFLSVQVECWRYGI